MSRIGKAIIKVPDGVTVTVDSGNVSVNGPKGTLQQMLSEGISLKQHDGVITIERASDETLHRAAHGLMRTLVANMIEGVANGYTKQLELQGVGYRALLQGTDLVLSLGYSHPIMVKAPEGIGFKVEKNIISVSGIDKAQVGEVAAKIRIHRKPEPYKGKGIRYVGEYVRRKDGKTAKA